VFCASLFATSCDSLQEGVGQPGKQAHAADAQRPELCPPPPSPRSGRQGVGGGGGSGGPQCESVGANSRRERKVAARCGPLKEKQTRLLTADCWPRRGQRRSRPRQAEVAAREWRRRRRRGREAGDVGRAAPSWLERWLRRGATIGPLAAIVCALRHGADVRAPGADSSSGHD